MYSEIFHVSTYQGAANIFCKGPDSNFFYICRPCGLCHTTQLCHCNMRTPRDNTKQIGITVFQWNFIYKIRWWSKYVLWIVVCQPLVYTNQSSHFFSQLHTILSYGCTINSLIRSFLCSSRLTVFCHYNQCCNNVSINSFSLFTCALMWVSLR